MGNLEQLVQIIKRGDAVEIEAARDLVDQESAAELAAVYWSLSSWEERDGLVHLLADHLVPHSEAIMIDFLHAPYDAINHIYVASAKAIALCQLVGSSQEYETYCDCFTAPATRHLLGETQEQPRGFWAQLWQRWRKRNQRTRGRLWQGFTGVCHLKDGRCFITDGALLIDNAYAQLQVAAQSNVSERSVEFLLRAGPTTRFHFEDLVLDAQGHYRGPQGIALNRFYVDYLRKLAGNREFHFRAGRLLEPVLILDGEKVIGVVMPMDV